MAHFAPEFSAYWQAETDPPAQLDAADHGKQVLSPSQQLALEELADLVNAARSIS